MYIEGKEYLTAEDVAAETGYKASTLIQYFRDGKIPGKRFFDKVYFSRIDIPLIHRLKETGELARRKTVPINQENLVLVHNPSNLSAEEIGKKVGQKISEKIKDDLKYEKEIELRDMAVEKIMHSSKENEKPETTEEPDSSRRKHFVLPEGDEDLYEDMKKIASIRGETIGEFMINLARPEVEKNRKHLRAIRA